MSENSGHKENREKPSDSPALMPPEDSEAKQTKHSRTGQLLVLGLGLLLVVAAVAVLFLPAKHESPPAVQPEVPRQATRQPAPPREANRLLEQWLRKQAAAEAENIAAWGGDSYAEAVVRAGECEQPLEEKLLTTARRACAAAIGILENLMASKDTLFADALRAGFLALENGAPQAASDQFQRALAIDADNNQAAQGLRRAASLPKVLHLLGAGQLKERVGDAQGALKAYAESSALDPDFVPAQENLDRLRTLIAETQFNKAMSLALQALAGGDLATATTALQEAQTHKSADPALRDLKQQLAQAQLVTKLDKLRRKGASLEKRENWREALKACDQALALDSKAAFAANCRERVSRRIELDGRLQAILSRPERLFADAPLKEARQVLSYASQMAPGPLIDSQIEQLTQLIRQAEAEVEVVILSDGLTEVVVYHVGRLGRFKKKKLVLRTGNYTATGSRNGYRDVRQTLRVRPDSGNLVFSLRCEEPI